MLCNDFLPCLSKKQLTQKWRLFKSKYLTVHQRKFKELLSTDEKSINLSSVVWDIALKKRKSY